MIKTLEFLKERQQAVEHGLRHGIYRLEMFRADKFGTIEPTPFDVLEFANAYVNTGGALFLDLLVAAGGTAFNNANAFIGVGDSSTATTAGMTDLQAATNKLRKAMNATFPSRSGQTMTWKADFGTSEANWTWNEIALFNASSGGTMLSRGIPGSPFTKTAGLLITAIYSIPIP